MSGGASRGWVEGPLGDQPREKWDRIIKCWEEGEE